jgi:hypothetical protein
MAELKDDIAAYDAMKADLEAKSLGKWVVVHERKLIGTYDSFDAAAKEAVHRFGRGPYLIRQVDVACGSFTSIKTARLRLYVRCTSNSDQTDASQRSDALCQKRP